MEYGAKNLDWSGNAGQRHDYEEVDPALKTRLANLKLPSRPSHKNS